MSRIITPWTSQPQVPVGINWGNPLTRGLEHAYMFSTGIPRNIVSNSAITSISNVTSGASIKGICANFSGTTSEIVCDTTRLNINGDVTLFRLYKKSGTWSTTNDFIVSAASTFIGLSSAANNAANLVAVQISPGYGYYTSQSLSIEKWYLHVATFSGGLLTGQYIDGTFDFSGTYIVFTQSGNSKVNFGRRPGSSVYANGSFALAGAFNRQLSASEIKSLSDNPWQIFQPITRRILVGAAAATSGSPYTLTAASGAVTLTGNATGLTAQRKLTAAAGAITLTGNATTLTTQRKLTATAGAITLTGNAATLTTARKLTADAGSITLTGNAATLTKTGVGARTLTADSGSFAVTGNAATLRKTHVLAANAGSITLTGNAATFSRGVALSAATGSITLTGNAATFNRTRVLTAATGSVVLTGNAASLVYMPEGTAFGITHLISAAARTTIKTAHVRTNIIEAQP